MERKENGISDIKRIMMMAQLPHVILKHISSSISLYRIQAIKKDMDIGYNLFWRSTKIENILLDGML